MEVKEAIRGRRSVRRFQDRPIPVRDMELLMEALRWAPSAGNLQARRFFFILDKQTRAAVAGASLAQMFIATAPLVVVACADMERISHYGARGKNLYVIQDVAVAVENMMLQAHELGLGSTWVGAFDEAAVSGILDLPEWLVPMAVVPVGYPAGKPPSAPRRLEIDEIVTVI